VPGLQELDCERADVVHAALLGEVVQYALDVFAHPQRGVRLIALALRQPPREATGKVLGRCGHGCAGRVIEGRQPAVADGVLGVDLVEPRDGPAVDVGVPGAAGEGFVPECPDYLVGDLRATDSPVYDRLDVLTLDRGGRLTVAELKPDRAPSAVTMQALNYAAMVSRFNFDKVVSISANFPARLAWPRTTP
jgi:hypothetical protein